jgi:hypothetical protein
LTSDIVGLADLDLLGVFEVAAPRAGADLARCAVGIPGDSRRLDGFFDGDEADFAGTASWRVT